MDKLNSAAYRAELTCITSSGVLGTLLFGAIYYSARFGFADFRIRDLVGMIFGPVISLFGVGVATTSYCNGRARRIVADHSTSLVDRANNFISDIRQMVADPDSHELGKLVTELDRIAAETDQAANAFFGLEDIPSNVRSHVEQLQSELAKVHDERVGDMSLDRYETAVGEIAEAMTKLSTHIAFERPSKTPRLYWLVSRKERCAAVIAGLFMGVPLVALLPSIGYRLGVHWIPLVYTLGAGIPTFGLCFSNMATDLVRRADLFRNLEGLVDQYEANDKAYRTMLRSSIEIGTQLRDEYRKYTEVSV